MTVDLNPASAVAANARYFGDFPALIHDSGELSFRALNERAARVAAVLSERGVVAGDRIAYAGRNSAAFVVTMLASLRLGGVFVPLNFRLAGPELEQVLIRSGAIAIVAEEGHRSVVDAVRGATKLSTFLLVDDEPACPAAGGHPDWCGWSSEIAGVEPLYTCVSRHSDDVALLMFTSGTTGLPKGVVLTYGNLWWNSVNVDSRLDTRRGDVTYAAAPLFHIGALNSFAVRALTRGGTLFVRREFQAEQFLSDIVERRVNSTFAVPSMFTALAQVPGVFDADLSSLRAVVVAAAPVPPSLLREFASHGVLLEQAWGLTETAPFVTHLPAELTLEKLGSAGIPMPHSEVKVVDLVTGEEAPSNVAGELTVRGPNVSPGYWEDAETTAAAYDEDGWFHTGDIGYFDEDGFLYIVDRLKDMIISGGENVYPAEVERALADLPGISDVAVIGVPDPRWGESVVAVVACRDGAEVTLEAAREHAAKAIARYKLPRELRVVSEVPRNASGKLDKQSIRRLVTESVS